MVPTILTVSGYYGIDDHSYESWIIKTARNAIMTIMTMLRQNFLVIFPFIC